MAFKICSKCEVELPATTEFFHKGRGRFSLCAWCKNCCREYKKHHYRNNRKQILKQKKKYYEKNRGLLLFCRKKYDQSERGRVVRKKYRESKEGREAIRKGNKKYLQTEKGIKMRKGVSKRHYENNRLSRNISIMMCRSLKGNKNNLHWEELVDYTLDNLKQHLEYLFEPGMSWDNYGKFGWHVDHIIPRAFFDREKLRDLKAKEFKKCWALENLQPLWAEENWKKGSKLDYGGKACY